MRAQAARQLMGGEALDDIVRLHAAVFGALAGSAPQAAHPAPTSGAAHLSSDGSAAANAALLRALAGGAVRGSGYSSGAGGLGEAGTFGGGDKEGGGLKPSRLGG